MKVAVGITGASGAIYAERLLRRLLDERAAGRVEQVAVVFTSNGWAVAEFERPEFLSWLAQRVAAGEAVEFRNDDFFTPVASGSAGYDALAVVPCSMGALGRIAGGVADDLLSRAADVMLKERSPMRRRTLILCPRETPLSLIHLRNLTAVCEAGGIVLPAMPSFYTQPQTLDEAVDTVVLRILSLLGLAPEGYRGWQE